MSTRHSVTLIGNSIPASLAAAFPADQFPDLSTSTDISFGCDPFKAQKVVDGRPQPVGADCPRFSSAWQRRLTTLSPDLAMFTVPQSITSDILVNGKVLHFGTAAYLDWLHGMLSTMRRESLAAGAKHFAVGTLSCHRMLAFTDDTRDVNNDERVRTINDEVRAWARSTGTPVIDFEKLLCAHGYDDTINGTPLYKDSLHYSAESGAIVWGWMAPQFQQILRDDQ